MDMLGEEAKSPVFEKDVLPLLEKYCYDCHGDGSDKGEVNLDSYREAVSIFGDTALWERVQFNVENWTMPPRDKKKQPSVEERELIASWIENTLFPCDCDFPDPGRVTMRRLNRVEYNNTIRDLFGVDFKPGEDFPADDTGYGFDNIGDVLTLTPFLVEKYLRAAEMVVDQFFDEVLAPPTIKERYTGYDFSGGERIRDERRLLLKKPIVFKYFFKKAGIYNIRINAYSTLEKDLPLAVQFKLGKDVLRTVDLKSKGTSKPGTLELKADVFPGDNVFVISYVKRKTDGSVGKEIKELEGKKKKRGLFIKYIEVNGPFDEDGQPFPKPFDPIFGESIPELKTEAYISGIIYRFASRAFRRFATKGEVKRLMRIYRTAVDDGQDFTFALAQVFEAVLVSPHFLYRREPPVDPLNEKPVQDISEFALASRLSFFLWSSMPDMELLKLASKQELRKNLDGQIERMLEDERSKALVEHFAGQWLQLRNVPNVDPDEEMFKEFDDSLKKSMKIETEMLFSFILDKDRSILELISANYSFLNERLARHYEIDGIQGVNFRLVNLDGTKRTSGILSHASILTITSHPTRTSPVKRGQWVLENLLGTEPPPPPPDVPSLEEAESVEAGASLREQLKAHRNKADCASCHTLLDPIGFGLENFDAIGRWRVRDGDFPIDASGVLASGETFSSAKELTSILVTRKKEDFVKCVIERMLTYALGRGTEFYDRCAIDAIYEKMEANDFRFSTLVFEIIKSVPFQKQRGNLQEH